jgi:uncharacterized protein (TIGR02118 family)
MRKSDAGAPNYALDALRAEPQSKSRTNTEGRSMSIKLVVLYPPPIDELVFERLYHGQHMPLMRSLITPASRLRTYRVRMPDGPFYRMAEVDFDDLGQLDAFARSEGGKGARRSSQHVSTGGEPCTLVCERDPE